MGHQHQDPRATAVVARDELLNGVIVSTVRLSGHDAGYESMAFAPGWPATGDVLAAARNRQLSEALAAHHALVERFKAAAGADTSDPNWVFRLLGLPPRRFPRGGS